MTDNDLLKRAYGLKDLDETEQLYDEWAKSYDTDTVEGMDYVAPALAAAKLAELAPSTNAVLDAGCGTGLAGAEFAKLSKAGIDGADLSQGMLGKARELGVYRNLTKANLAQPLEIADDNYDAVLCVDTLTSGHVGPEALDEFSRVVRAGGLVVFTVHENVWDAQGHQAYLDGMVERGLVDVREISEQPYHRSENMTCKLCVLQVR